MKRQLLLALGSQGPFLGDEALETLFDSIPTLASLPDLCEQATAILMNRRMELAAKPVGSGDSLARIDAMLAALASSAGAAKSLERRLTDIGTMVGRMFDAMKFDFLFDPTRQLLSIGYRVADGSLDPNCYDLLASEARLASFVAIAKGDVPARHWFRLGRAHDSGGSRFRSDFLVRVDVRVLDAFAGDARARSGVCSNRPID